MASDQETVVIWVLQDMIILEDSSFGPVYSFTTWTELLDVLRLDYVVIRVKKH